MDQRQMPPKILYVHGLKPPASLRGTAGNQGQECLMKRSKSFPIRPLGFGLEIKTEAGCKAKNSPVNRAKVAPGEFLLP